MNVRVNKAQRIVLALYLLFIAYCFVWIPWSVTTTGRYGADHQRLGYGWVWAGPRFSPSTTSDAKDFSNVDQFVADSVEHNRISPHAMPDATILLFRIIAVTAVAGTLFS
jgi:hypothetical protein